MEKSGLSSLIEYLGRKTDLLILLLLAFYLCATITSLNLVSASLGTPFGGLRTAIPGIISLACFLPVFALADFSFGYIVGIVFYGTIAGFVWLSYFTEFEYDHDIARWSSVLALTTFLLCPLFQMWTMPRAFKISIETMDKALTGALVAAVMVLIADIQFGFAIVGMDEAQRLRASLQRPIFLNYVTNNLVHAILPFAFAFFAQRGRWLKAGTCLIIIASFYPALLNKTVLFAPLWLVYILLMFRVFAPKRAWVLCLLTPLLLGLILHATAAPTGKLSVFYLVNERFFAIPSIALDRYAHFFTNNPPTYFCQINVVRWLTGCPYSTELGGIFAEHYRLGNLNASLFATEGIASVGFKCMPIVTLLCGAAGNSLSRRLSPMFVATSSAVAVQALMNVPLSIAVLTDGGHALYTLVPLS
jgi:hypothetical protein